MRNYPHLFYAFFLSFLSFGLWGQYPDSLYNDDPHQLYPIGVEREPVEWISADGGTVDRQRVEPPFWWVGMHHPTLQLLIYDQDIQNCSVELAYPGVALKAVHRLENPNYLFLDLEIGPATAAGSFDIVLCGGSDRERVYTYELKERRSDPLAFQGLTSSDLIYLLMPDRFANGDYANDSFDELRQWGIHRKKSMFRHGGDLVGVMERLDYLQDLGVTALWLNPVLENDQLFGSFHGYGITDLYRVDPRIGTNDQYRQLVDLCHERGIKVIMDVIPNHVGDKHWFIRDLPAEDWIHQFPEFTRTTYRDPVLVDPYAASKDLREMADGWFDSVMPDLNQSNPFLATYFIQNSIWWTEFSGQDAFRIDTYFYADQDFMAEWGRRIKEEFPTLTAFGETWVQGHVFQARFTQGNKIEGSKDTYLDGITDFQLYYDLQEMLGGDNGWTTGVNGIYYTLAQDFLYGDPFQNVIFLDNHDLPRYFTTVGENLDKYKLGMAFLLTTRGIPMIYYGTEILLGGSGGGAFAEGGRVDFPGGWKEDTTNKFEASGRTAEEQEAFDYFTHLAHFRKQSSALQTGRLTQYIPRDGVYTYFRYDETQTIMVLLNSSAETRKVDLTRFAEHIGDFTQGRDAVSGTEVSLSSGQLEIGGLQGLILVLGSTGSNEK